MIIRKGLVVLYSKSPVSTVARKMGTYATKNIRILTIVNNVNMGFLMANLVAKQCNV